MVPGSSQSRFGRGFFIPISHLAVKFSLPPERAWMGAQDYFTDMIIPDQFKKTEVEELTNLLRQKIMWHQAGGPMDKERYTDVKRTINRLLIAIDTQMGIADADQGRYHE
ncbi:MAG: hypothetical protein CVV33_00020 [Methanomicrobiales archaeon HGW-Methanomicrobiales-4]|nr:MAG: hypothetical protein CVV33_00020 [Methanomicrobiales archaeon HGW-Methanomicrobiales-4]